MSQLLHFAITVAITAVAVVIGVAAVGLLYLGLLVVLLVGATSHV